MKIFILIFAFIFLSSIKKSKANETSSAYPSVESFNEAKGSSSLSAIFDVTLSERQSFLQSYEFFKNEQYESALALLGKVNTSSDLKSVVYYLYGLNYFYTQNYDLAEKYFLETTQFHDLKELHWAYFYLGLTQYRKNNLEKSINSFDLALDVSNDAKFDELAQQAKMNVLRAQRKIDQDNQKFILILAAGYAYDSNVLNVSEASQSLKGHNLQTSLFLSYRALDKENQLLEPSIYLANSYTLNNKLQEDSNLQLADFTQALLSIPYTTTVFDFKSVTTLASGLYFLPADSKNRELSISLFYGKQNLIIPLKSNLDLDMQLLIGRDQSQLTYLNAKDSQTAVKYDLSGFFKYTLSSNSKKHVRAGLGFIKNSADGANADYNKIYSNIGYEWPTKFQTFSDVSLNYAEARYDKSELKRIDKTGDLKYLLSKDLNHKSSLTGFVGLSFNNSTIADFKYNDYFLGLQYLYALKF